MHERDWVKLAIKYEQILESKLNKWKSNLIDLSKRNRLLNFAENSSSVLRFKMEMEDLFSGLLEDYQYKVNSIVDMQAYVLKEKRRKKRSKDITVSEADQQVKLWGEIADKDEDEIENAYGKLEKQLNGIRLKAKTFSDEKGINTLFIGFGFLKWKESDDSNIYIKSPIVLLPVILKRENVNEPYCIEKYSDEVTINPTLLQKLKVDFGLNFSFNQEEGDLTLADIITQFESQIRNQKDWEVVKDSYLGLFSFSKLVMFKDFEQYADLLKKHELVQKLAGVSDQTTYSERDSYEDIREHDRKTRSAESFQILDADSSQQEAILAVQKGKSFIISGPPGTGKSQTITNIIAESLAKGKQVLFVSEKKAALNVVKKRLDDQFLGDFCLELHSNNVSKRYVLEELIRTSGLLYSPNRSPVNFDSFDRMKARLNEYVDALHTKIEPLQLTPQYVHGLLAKMHDVDELAYTIEDIQSVNRSRLEDINELLQKMETYSDVIKNHEQHVWRGALQTRFTLELQGNISANFRKLANGLESVEDKIRNMPSFIWAYWGTTPETVERIQNLSNSLNQIPKIPRYWLSDDKSYDTSKEVYDQMKETFLRFAGKQNQLFEFYNENVISLDLDQIEYTISRKFQHELHGLIKNPDTFLDDIVACKQELLNAVQKTEKELAILLSTQAFSNEIFGVQFPNVSINNIQAFLTIGKYILINPTPTPVWFERAKHQQLIEEVRETKSKFEEYTSERMAFEQRYDLDLLNEIDVKDVFQRFMNEYAGFFRIFKRRFWDDKKKLKLFQKEKTNLSYEELSKDLRQAVKLVEKKAWITEADPELKRRFGKTYQGERTDWEQLCQNMINVYELCSFLEAAELPKSGIEKLMLDLNSYQLERVKTKFHEITEALSRFNNQMGILFDQVHIANVLEQKDEDLLFVEGNLQRIHEISEELQTGVNELTQFSNKNRWKNSKEFIADIHEIKEYMEMKQNIENVMNDYQYLYGPLFHRYETDWNEVFSAIQWTQKLLDIWDGKVPESMIELIFDESRIQYAQFMQHVREIAIAWNNTVRERDFFFTVFPRDAKLFGQNTFQQADLRNIIQHLDVWVDESYKLEEWNAFQNVLQESSEYGIAEFVYEIMNPDDHQGNTRDLFLKRFYKLWLDYAYSLLPSLSLFYFDQHQRLLDEFKNTDQAQIKQNGARLHHILMNNKEMFLNSFTGIQHTEASILSREVQKQKRHKAIRRLFSEIPNLLTALKPCMMMSPMSVSQFIDPNIIKFDVVIFDEASQICSEDAIGSIMRGKQIIIAGDNKQLPPTRFFGTTAEEDEEFIDEEDSTNEIYESVLDEAAVFMPTVPLKWHYRSKHESLIAFSNREIYNNDLYTFPSSSSADNDGVSLVYVSEGVYDRGGSKKNRIEAMAVAKLIFEHFLNSRRSLGVIAFSEAQQEAIRDYVDEIRKKRPEFEKFFTEDTAEPFFIKNLENVQGDERDTIIFSVGYGKDGNGKLHYNFGPLNKPGGERRLNVAITRAKYEVKIVSSILHTDLDDEKLNKLGPQLLKSYLYYASTRGKFNPNSSTNSDVGFDSPLEEDVYDALTARGLILHKQVGCSSYRIDLAVVDPNHPGRYLLGIECDGATYHSSKTARDRDRLRQQVLESLGWKIHRIWSQDWFKRKRHEIEKIVSLVNEINCKN